MAEWLTLPTEKLFDQPDQQAFLEARRLRQCKACGKEFDCVPPRFAVCPHCAGLGIRLFDRLTIIAGRRFGKATHVNTPIPTPSGWKTMLEIEIGDYVFDEHGNPVKVIAATSPFFSKTCFEVIFSDDNSIITDAEHEWEVHDKSYRKSLGRRIKKNTHWSKPTTGPRVVTTAQMLAEGLSYQGKESKFAIPNTKPLNYSTKELLIDPYVLGAWLGDGDSIGSGFTCNDLEILLECANRGYPARKQQSSKYHYGLGVGIEEPLVKKLKAIGLLNNKHVPRAYLEGNITQRLDLLKGLMDTDGTCDVGGNCEFCNTNPVLAYQVYDLLISLGEKPTIKVGDAKLYGRITGKKYRVHFTPSQPVFILTRKLKRQRILTRNWVKYRYITAIKPVESSFVKCITVDSPTSLYLAGKACIPTHNSRIGSIAGAEESTIPNSIGWACAPNNPKLHRYVIPAFQRLIPKDWVKDWSVEHKDLTLKNGSLIHFQTLEDPDQGRGQGLDWLWVDEVCELTKAHWEVIRPSLAGDTVAFFTTSPRSFDWVYEELYKPAEESIPGYWACHAKTSESANPRITPEFLAREKAQMSEAMYRQEYEADFIIFTGAIYGGLIDPQILHTDQEIQRIIPEWPEIASWRQVLVGIDTGADHPFGAVKLISTELGLVVVGEYLERHKSFTEHKASLVRLAANSNTKWAINKNERQPRIELAQPPYSITCQPAENDQISGIERVKSWLHARQLFFVERLCPLTIKQMKSYRWAENTSPKDDSKRAERVYKKEDELPDCVRYALQTWPVLPRHIELTDVPRDLSNFPEEQRASIQRMRKIDQDQPLKPVDITGDFWN